MVGVLHKLASAGPVYDLIQEVVGIRYIYRRFSRVLATLPAYRTVLDLGGGTGRIRELLSADCQYFCLDNEMPKLLQVPQRSESAFPILGDATMTAVASGSMDLVICMAVSHHLTDPELQRMVLEVTRVLRPGGRFMFHDALWAPGWWPGRILWSLDRGSNPRSKDRLVNVIASQIRIVHQEEFRLSHKYMIVVGSKT